jgi:hypothetical protein
MPTRRGASTAKSAASVLRWPTRSVEARYEDGFLKPTKPLQLRPGKKVGLIVFI